MDGVMDRVCKDDRARNSSDDYPEVADAGFAINWIIAREYRAAAERAHP
jgi:hypothetical protein